ncbi:hypothetical protein LZ30DRAFT_419968 [Colletotrichum cereale]|nr:hypothetical protein LZ30DRAFT_419968 [Colletotrichum cereale]
MNWPQSSYLPRSSTYGYLSLTKLDLAGDQNRHSGPTSTGPSLPLSLSPYRQVIAQKRPASAPTGAYYPYLLLRPREPYSSERAIHPSNYPGSPGIPVTASSSSSSSSSSDRRHTRCHRLLADSVASMHARMRVLSSPHPTIRRMETRDGTHGIASSPGSARACFTPISSLLPPTFVPGRFDRGSVRI